MKVQQAPEPVQAALLFPEMVASATAQLKIGGTTRTNSATTTRVNSVFETDEKRFRFSHSKARGGPPVKPSNLPPGGATAGACTVTTRSPLALAKAYGKGSPGGRDCSAK